MSQISVELNDTIRLMSALLAMTTWPEQEQSIKPHGVHVHARRTRDHLAPAEYHPAVVTMQELLESGLTLDTIFSAASYLTPDFQPRADAPDWIPAKWPAQISDFVRGTNIAELWSAEHEFWDGAVAQSQRALAAGDPLGMLERFFGKQDVDLIFQPNLTYPSAQSLGWRDGRRLIAVAPPQVAWGNNPPWPYDENPADTPRDAFSTYAKTLLHEMFEANPDQADAAQKVKLPVPNTFLARYPDWFDQFAVLFVSGLTALYLRENFGEAESKSYAVMVKRAHGFDALPTVIDVLEKYLESYKAGKYTSFVEYLPTFIKAMRVAEGMKKA